MALYWHFRSKEELLAALGDQVWAEIDVTIDPAAAWQSQLRGLMESLVAVLRGPPVRVSAAAVGPEAARRGVASRSPRRRSTCCARRLRARCSASEIARSALWTGLMLVMSEPGFNPSQAPHERAEQLRQERIRLAMLPPDRFPAGRRRGPMTSCDDPDFHYQFGIDLFVAGVVALSGI